MSRTFVVRPTAISCIAAVTFAIVSISTIVATIAYISVFVSLAIVSGTPTIRPFVAAAEMSVQMMTVVATNDEIETTRTFPIFSSRPVAEQGFSS
jgi:hypothetical protein